MRFKSSYNNVDEELFHNTRKLLEIYRDVVFSVEASVLRTRCSFVNEYGQTIDEFLESAYCAGYDVRNKQIQMQVEVIESNKRMIDIINNAMAFMKEKHRLGEKYYWLLYHTYICPQQKDAVEDIIQSIYPYFGEMSWKTYYSYRKQAISCLGSILWGYTTREVISITENFLKKVE